MNRVTWLAGYLILVFVGGALLAPQLWALVQSLAQTDGGTWLQGLARHPFHRYVHRCLLGLALIGLVPLARGLGCRHLRDVGLSADRKWLRRWVSGAAVGFLMFAACVVFELELGVTEWREARGWTAAVRAISGAALTALIVGVLEEILFRGVLCGGLRRSLGWPMAILISSAVYSIVHFFERPPAPEVVTWSSGLVTVGQMLEGFVTSERLVPRFFTLLGAGILLALMFRRTGTLYFSMGLHSGWVYWIKFRGWLTASAAVREGQVSPEVVSAWVNFVVISLTLMVVAGLEHLHRRAPREGNDPTKS